MRVSKAKGIAFWAASVVLLSLVVFGARRRGPVVTILNPKFQLLTVTVSHGKVHKLYRSGPVAGRLLELLARVGLAPGNAPLAAWSPQPCDALVVRYTGDFARNELSSVTAEVVGASGSATRLSCRAGFNEAGHRYGTVWLLPTPLTNLTVRLSAGSQKAALAEFRVSGQAR